MGGVYCPFWWKAEKVKKVIMYSWLSQEHTGSCTVCNHFKFIHWSRQSRSWMPSQNTDQGLPFALSV